MHRLRLAETAVKELSAHAARRAAKRLLRAGDVRNQFILMKLRAARDDGLDHGDANAAAEIAQQIDRSGNLTTLFLRDAHIRGGVDRNEEQCEAEILPEFVSCCRGEIDLKIDVCHVICCERTEQKAETDQPTRIEPSDELS